MAKFLFPLSPCLFSSPLSIHYHSKHCLYQRITDKRKAISTAPPKSYPNPEFCSKAALAHHSLVRDALCSCGHQSNACAFLCSLHNKHPVHPLPPPPIPLLLQARPSHPASFRDPKQRVRLFLLHMPIPVLPRTSTCTAPPCLALPAPTHIEALCFVAVVCCPLWLELRLWRRRGTLAVCIISNRSVYPPSSHTHPTLDKAHHCTPNHSHPHTSYLLTTTQEAGTDFFPCSVPSVLPNEAVGE